MQHSNMYFNVLSIFPSQWVVKSSSCLKWSSKIKARMVSWIKMWHMFLEVQVHVISCRIRVLIRLRLCSPSVETACEHLLQHIMQILIFSIKSSTSRSIVSQCVWKKFYFICLVIVFHCPFLNLPIFSHGCEGTSMNETWPADTFQSRQFLVLPYSQMENLM